MTTPRLAQALLAGLLVLSATPLGAQNLPSLPGAGLGGGAMAPSPLGGGATGALGAAAGHGGNPLAPSPLGGGAAGALAGAAGRGGNPLAPAPVGGGTAGALGGALTR
jgi:hypothetical protein